MAFEVEVGVPALAFLGELKFGVTVGTGFCRLCATLVERKAMSVAKGSLSRKTSAMRSKFTF